MSSRDGSSKSALVYIASTSDGCPISLSDNTRVRSLVPQQYLTDDPAKADIILLNTCAFDGKREARTVRIIQELSEKYPGKKIFIGGCLPKIDDRLLSRLPHSGTFSLEEPASISSLLAKEGLGAVMGCKVPYEHDVLVGEDLSDLRIENKALQLIRRAFLFIETKLKVRISPLRQIVSCSVVGEHSYLVLTGRGCTGNCAYCAIRYVRGSVKSRVLSDVLGDIRKGIEQGYSDIWLIGDDVGSWGQDLGSNSALLIQEILKIEHNFRLVITAFDPKWFVLFNDEMEAICGSRKVVLLTIPIQSGSARMVRSMCRQYDPQEVGARVSRLRAKNPHLLFKTHIMVGFPGETWSDFWQSIKEAFRYDIVVPLIFSPRYKTPAALMEEQVGTVVKWVRFALLNLSIWMRFLFMILSSFSVSIARGESDPVRPHSRHVGGSRVTPK